MNTQKPEEKITGDGKVLDVIDTFDTIQGEGLFSGHHAFFIRLAGCNLNCPFCDTDYTSGRNKQSIIAILNKVFKIKRIKLVVITGGEPFRQNISLLVKKLVDYKYLVQIETNGTLPLTPEFPKYSRNVYIVCSPKSSEIHESIKTCRNGVKFKYIMDAKNLNKDDGLPNIMLGRNIGKNKHVYRTSTNPIYILPMDTDDEAQTRANIQAAKDYVLNNNKGVFQFQIHKFLGVM